jgi:sulfotransferase family protein
VPVRGEEKRALKEAAVTSAKRTVRWAALTAVRPTSGRRMLPDYVIAGAQRAGTTSLHRHLLGHPNVARALLGLKGMHYFSTNYSRGFSWYRSHFPTNAAKARFEAANGSKLVAGEGSPYYLFHPLALERMADALPDAKVIVMLRDPVARAYSHYQHMLFEGLERVGSFEEALALEPERLEGEVDKILADPRYRSFHHQHHSYVARGHYAEQITKLWSLYPREQTLILRSEDFLADPAAGLAETVEFLGLPAFEFPAELREHNVGRYPKIDPDAKARLAEHFREPNERLYALLGRDMGWAT